MIVREALPSVYLVAGDQKALVCEDGGSLAEISRVDQADFMYLEAADQLAGRNAHQVFQQLEFDF